MNIVFSINGSSSGPAYIGWTPQPCTLKITNMGIPAGSSMPIVLSNLSTSGGQVVFSTSPYGNTVGVMFLNAKEGVVINLYIAGSVASSSDQDGGIKISNSLGTVLYTRTLMVRVRKDGNNLTPAERDRFLHAMATLNDAGDYLTLCNMHVTSASSEIHSRPSFLVWHRTYVLDLERRLQAIDPSVTVPYWRFDLPAPNIFSADFMGVPSTTTSTLQFSPTNPLLGWAISGARALTRTPSFNTATQGADVRSQDGTLALGTNFDAFKFMENDPHGSAHLSFNGPINNPPTAPQDPLFFMLHSNVDRLWALWQYVNKRYSVGDVNTYPHIGRSPVPSPSFPPRIGDYLQDTMWPWNNDTNFPRPNTAPGGPMRQLPYPSKPSAISVLWEMIDYQNLNAGSVPNYFDYDTIPYKPLIQ